MGERRLHAIDGTAAPDAHPYTIEQLAAETGFTVRTIRSHRARNLLQPPVVGDDRVGYYGAEHVDRLKLIRELQAEGFNLKTIKRVVERAPSDRLLSAIQLATEPFETEEPQVVTAEELQARFEVDERPDRMLAESEKLGILLPLGDGRYEAPAPSLLDVAQELVSRGVPISHSLAVVKKVRDSCRSVAREFIRLFVDDVVRPFKDEGMPAERWPEMLETIERLRPMSAQVVLAVYQMTMSAEVEQATTRELEQLLKGAAR